MRCSYFKSSVWAPEPAKVPILIKFLNNSKIIFTKKNHNHLILYFSVFIYFIILEPTRDNSKTTLGIPHSHSEPHQYYTNTVISIQEYPKITPGLLQDNPRTISNHLQDHSTLSKDQLKINQGLSLKSTQ